MCARSKCAKPHGQRSHVQELRPVVGPADSSVPVPAIPTITEGKKKEEDDQQIVVFPFNKYSFDCKEDTIFTIPKYH